MLLAGGGTLAGVYYATHLEKVPISGIHFIHSLFALFFLFFFFLPPYH